MIDEATAMSRFPPVSNERRRDDLTFEITGGSGQGLFRYDTGENDKGKLVVDAEDGLPLDGTTEYELYVEVTDGNGGSDTATVTINLLPLVALTGDTHAVESTGDTITINIVRYANDLSDQLSVEYEVHWYDATGDDLLNPGDLVDDANATKANSIGTGTFCSEDSAK